MNLMVAHMLYIVLLSSTAPLIMYAAQASCAPAASMSFATRSMTLT